MLPATLYPFQHLGGEKIDVKGLGTLVRVFSIGKEGEVWYYATAGENGLSGEIQSDSCPELS